MSTVRLDFHSAFDMLDFVQVVSDHVGRMSGLDDEALHWVGVAVRESVINAIKHGNGLDERKRVHVEFTSLNGDAPPGLLIRVRDEGPGFDPETLPDPLAPVVVCTASPLSNKIVGDVQGHHVLESPTISKPCFLGWKPS